LVSHNNYPHVQAKSYSEKPCINHIFTLSEPIQAVAFLLPAENLEQENC